MIRSLTSTCIVLLCFFASVATLPREKFYRALGEQIEFKAIHKMGEIKSIVWKFTKAGETEKVVDWEPEYDTEEFGQFKSRVFLNISTGDLTVRDLTAQDTGHFVVDINSKELETSYDLHVMAKVSKPTIDVELPMIAENVRFLTCKADTSTEQTLTWKDGDGTQLGNESHLTVSRTYNLDTKYLCILKNPVSEERSDPVREEDIFPPDGPPAGQIAGFTFIAIIGIIVVTLCCIIPCLFACNQRLHDSLTKSENSFIKGYRRLLDRIIGPHGKSSGNKDAEKGDSTGGDPVESVPLMPESARPSTGPNPHGNESNNVHQSGDHTGPREESSENKDAEKGDSTGGPNPHGNESNNVDQSGDHTGPREESSENKDAEKGDSTGGASQHEKESNNVDQSGDHMDY